MPSTEYIMVEVLDQPISINLQNEHRYLYSSDTLIMFVQKKRNKQKQVLTIILAVSLCLLQFIEDYLTQTTSVQWDHLKD